MDCVVCSFTECGRLSNLEHHASNLNLKSKQGVSPKVFQKSSERFAFFEDEQGRNTILDSSLGERRRG